MATCDGDDLTDGEIVAIVVCLLILFGASPRPLASYTIVAGVTHRRRGTVFLVAFFFLWVTDRCGCRLTCCERQAQIGLMPSETSPYGSVHRPRAFR